MPEHSTTRRMFEEMDKLTESIASEPKAPRWLPAFGFCLRLWVSCVLISLFIFVMYLNVKSYQSGKRADQLRQQVASQTSRPYEPVSPIRPAMILSTLITATAMGWTVCNRKAWRFRQEEKDIENVRD